MKKLAISTILGAALALLCSCGSSTKEATDPIPATSCALVAGDWHLTAVAGESPAGFDIYMRLDKSGKFEMYQQLQTIRYTKYTGTFQFADGVMSGRYDDGEAWKSAYTAVLNAKRTTLTLTSATATDNVSVFTREAIPAEVFDHLASDDTSRTTTAEQPAVGRFL